MESVGNMLKRKDGTPLRAQVKGVFKKDDRSSRTSNHVSRPLASLQDPAVFGPPPTRTGGTSVIAPPPLRPSQQPALPARPGVTPTHAQPSQDSAEELSRPYRTDTTGLATANLPPPPVRRDGPASQNPPPYSPSANKPTPPRLPPRLPPRAAPASPGLAPPPPARTAITAPLPPPSRAPGSTTQAAANRLSEAGISVPGLGIGRPPASPARPGSAGQLSGLQSRFARPGTSSAASSPPGEGTTLAQKQAALQTATNFRRDPGSVSLADARAAASTVDNFRQRHGEQVAAGMVGIDNANRKYGVADRLGRYAGREDAQVEQGQSSGVGLGAGTGTDAGANSFTSAVGLLGKKKPAPPPPTRKSRLGGSIPESDPNTYGGGPPPIPESTRPF